MPSFETVRSVQRAFKVLQAINCYNGIGITELAKVTELPRPTVHRLLETLETLGFVVVSPSDHKWRPTLYSKSLSAGFCDESWVSQIAMPTMMVLDKKIVWPIDLVTYDNYEMVVRESTHSRSPFSVDRGMVGRRLPILETSAGRAYLAFANAVEREAVLARLAASDENKFRTRRKFVNRLLEETRKRGLGFRNDGFRSNTSSISAPIYFNDRVLACLTVIWIRSAMPFEAGVQKYGEPLLAACRRITELLETDENQIELARQTI